MVYSASMEEYGRKPHIPCLLASCHQIYNEMQPFLFRHSGWYPNSICIGPRLPLALHSIDGPRRSRRAWKTCRYSHWDLLPLSSLSIDLEYEGIIDNPYLNTLSLEDFCDRRFMAMKEDGASWASPSNTTLQEIDARLKQTVHHSHCWLERNLGDIYRALKLKTRLTEVTFNIVVTRWDLVDFSPRGGFKCGIFQHLRAFTMLPLCCEIKATSVADKTCDTEHLREQQLKHATAVAGWFNKRRTKWLSRQQFLTRRSDFLWDVRVLLGDPPAPDAPPVLENPSIRCRVCQSMFPSNNKLHQHLRDMSNQYVETEDCGGHYEYWYGCSREQVYKNWYDGYYRQPWPLHVRRNAEGKEIPRPTTEPVAPDGW